LLAVPEIGALTAAPGQNRHRIHIGFFRYSQGNSQTERLIEKRKTAFPHSGQKGLEERDGKPGRRRKTHSGGLRFSQAKDDVSVRILYNLERN
jgi:hypothetical protein